jgi:hypothetical protein
VALYAFFACSIPVLLSYLLYTWLNRRGYGDIGLLLLNCLIASLIYLTYTAIYPDDAFYFDEFKKVTKRVPPSSAEIIKADATYPDLQGDYISAALLRCSKSDYQYLLTELGHDKKNMRLTDEPIHYDITAMLGYRIEEHIKTAFRRISNQSGTNLYIAFLKDGCTVAVIVFKM